MGLVAGLQVGQALGCSGLGLGSAVPVPHVPGHPTSICNEGINSVHTVSYGTMFFPLQFMALMLHTKLKSEKQGA